MLIENLIAIKSYKNIFMLTYFDAIIQEVDEINIHRR